MTTHSSHWVTSLLDPRSRASPIFLKVLLEALPFNPFADSV